MNRSSLLLAMFCAVVLFAVLLLSVGGSFHQPPAAQGAKLYNAANEVLLTGKVMETLDFACPVSEGEVGSHVMLQTASGIVKIHLAPGRIMRSQKIKFAPGEEISVVGAKVRLYGDDDVIARQITRGNEQIFVRDPEGKLMLVQ